MIGGREEHLHVKLDTGLMYKLEKPQSLKPSRIPVIHLHLLLFALMKVLTSTEAMLTYFLFLITSCFIINYLDNFLESVHIIFPLCLQPVIRKQLLLRTGGKLCEGHQHILLTSENQTLMLLYKTCIFKIFYH